MNLIPFEQQTALARAFVQSKLFGVQNEAQALALMALCEAEGLHPAKAIQEYHIIQGRPALKADAMLARFQRAGGSVKWTQYTDSCVCGVFSHPQGGSVQVDWTLDRARSIGLAGRDNWKNYPRNMMRARCISEGVRAVYPGIATGMYTVEEVQDMGPTREKDMGPADVVQPQIDQGELAQLADYLNAAESLDELQDAWKKLTPEQRRALNDTKEAVKTRLAQPQATE